MRFDFFILDKEVYIPKQVPVNNITTPIQLEKAIVMINKNMQIKREIFE